MSIFEKNKGISVIWFMMIPLYLFLLSSCAGLLAPLITHSASELIKTASNKQYTYPKRPSQRGTVIPQDIHDRKYVREVQRLLTKAGYHPGPIDGIPGRKTERALRSFQLDNSLYASGEPDSATYNRLISLLGVTPYNQGTYTKQTGRHPSQATRKTYSNRSNQETGGSGATSFIESGGTTVRMVGETLNALGAQNQGSFIGGQMNLAGGIYEAMGTTIEGGADEMASGKSISLSEANRRATVAVTGAVRDWSGTNRSRYEIRNAQTVLRRLGYYTGALDGLMGPATRKAVRIQQRYAGLPETGELDDLTMKSLGF